MKKVLVLTATLLVTVLSFGQTLQRYTDSNGMEWEGYGYDNFRIAVNESFNDFNGKFFQLMVMVINERGKEVSFAVSDIKASVTKKGKVTDLKVLDKAQYTKIIQQKQAAKSFGASLLNSVASAGGQGQDVVKEVPNHVNTETIEKYYLVPTQVKSGVENAYTSYLMVQAAAGETLNVEITIDGDTYKFDWDVKDQK